MLLSSVFVQQVFCHCTFSTESLQLVLPYQNSQPQYLERLLDLHTFFLIALFFGNLGCGDSTGETKTMMKGNVCPQWWRQRRTSGWE